MAVSLPLPIPGWVFTPPARAAERVHVTPSRGLVIAHGARLGIIIAAACVAIFLDASTAYESSTALPYIAGAVGATPDQASWIVTLFSAAYDTSILLSTWFLARLGRRAYFVGSLLGFAACSIACACSSEYHVFLVFRLQQGFALGSFFSCGVLALFMTIPDRLRLFGVMLFSMASQLGGALGPAVSGYLVYNDDWQWVFILSALPAVVLAAGIAATLRDPVEPERVPFDIIGAVLIGVTFLALQYLVNEGERRNWTEDPWVVLALIVTPVFGAAMLVWKLRFSPHPFLDFRVLRHRNLVIGAIFGAGFGILLQVATLIGGFVEDALQFTPTLGGGLDALRAIAIVVIVPIATIALEKRWLGVRSMLVIGLAATFAGFFIEMSATTTGSDFRSFIIPFAAIGIGIAVRYRALATVIFGVLPPADLIMGLLVYKMSGVLGGALAVPIFVTLLDHRIAAHVNDLTGSITLGEPAIRQFMQAGQGGAKALEGLVTMQATTMAYADLWGVAAVIALVLVPFVFALDMRRRSET
jgi:DHA2 family multidrug resistance protein